MAAPTERVALKAEWQMSAASDGQRIGTVALGVANLVGVVVLGSLLADPQVMIMCTLQYITHASTLALTMNRTDGD